MYLSYRLSIKGCCVYPNEKITIEAIVEAFIQYYLLYHALPRAIISDYRDQFVGYI